MTEWKNQLLAVAEVLVMLPTELMPIILDYVKARIHQWKSPIEPKQPCHFSHHLPVFASSQYSTEDAPLSWALETHVGRTPTGKLLDAVITIGIEFDNTYLWRNLLEVHIIKSTIVVLSDPSNDTVPDFRHEVNRSRGDYYENANACPGVLVRIDPPNGCIWVSCGKTRDVKITCSKSLECVRPLVRVARCTDVSMFFVPC
jgi:hypothetical protein